MSLQAQKSPVQVEEATLKSYAGLYGEKKLVWEDGQLYFFPFPDKKTKLLPLRKDLFELADIKSVRLKVLTENGTVAGIAEVFSNGRVEKHMKKVL